MFKMEIFNIHKLIPHQTASLLDSPGSSTVTSSTTTNTLEKLVLLLAAMVPPFCLSWKNTHTQNEESERWVSSHACERLQKLLRSTPPPV